MEEDSFQAMKIAKESLPPDEVVKEWEEKARNEMVHSY